MIAPPRRRYTRWLHTPFAGMVGVTLLMLFSGLGQGDVRIDGAIYAWVSKWIVVSGEWFDLYLDRGETRYYNKPPLQFWLQAVAMHVFGVNTWAVKLVTPLFGLGCVVLTYAIARRGFSAAVAATAGIVLATTYTFFRHAVGVRLDPGVGFFSLLALYAGLAPMYHDRSARMTMPWVVIGLAWGCGMLLKSPVVLLTVPILIGAWAWQRRLDLVVNWRWLLAAAIALAIVSPWYVQQYLQDGERFLRQHVYEQQLERISGEGLGANPWYHLFAKVGTHYWPWLPLAVGGIAAMAVRARRQSWPAARLVVVWAVVWFVAAHFVTRKYERYLIPWYPAMAIGAAYLLAMTPVWKGWRRHVLRHAAPVSLAVLLLIELGNVRMHRTESPALQTVAPIINASGATLHVADALGTNSHSRTLFYVDAPVRVVEGKDFTAARSGDFIGVPDDWAEDAALRLPPSIELARDRRAVYYVVK